MALGFRRIEGVCVVSVALAVVVNSRQRMQKLINVRVIIIDFVKQCDLGIGSNDFSSDWKVFLRDWIKMIRRVRGSKVWVFQVRLP